MRREEQDEKIASLLGGLESVDAPHGFESRVMRRIAERGLGGEVNRPVLLLMLKFAAPAAMLVLMGMFFVFFGDSEVSNALVPPVQESNTPLAPATTEVPLTVDGALASTLPTEPPAAQPPVNTARPKPASSPRIMSEDFAVQGPGETLRPEGVDPRPETEAPPSRRFSPIQLLDIIGIRSGCTPANCTVREVRANSPAAKSGVLENDVVISIDEKPIDTTHLYSEKPEIRSITVQRDGRVVRILFRY
jgi:membrane-associated protease RseP (regulator of RpoE activity)